MLADETTIRTNFLHLLSHLLLREGKRTTSGKSGNQKLTRFLDTDDTHGRDTETVDDVTSLHNKKSTLEEKLEFKGNGADLCRILYVVYDSDKQTKEGIEERKFVVLALRNLLCISYTAKETAIEGKFRNKVSDGNIYAATFPGVLGTLKFASLRRSKDKPSCLHSTVSHTVYN